MIRGIGTDIIEIERFKNLSEGFTERIYSPAEKRLFHGMNYQTLAGNFAAKEAVAKALGTGFKGPSPREIEILRKKDGSPYVLLSGKAREIFNELGGGTILITISHSKENAVAFAVFDSEKRITYTKGTDNKDIKE